MIQYWYIILCIGMFSVYELFLSGFVERRRAQNLMARYPRAAHHGAFARDGAHARATARRRPSSSRVCPFATRRGGGAVEGVATERGFARAHAQRIR